ncbi:MAG: alcohol dehydrogenase [Ectothiorhodospiraceae bacterium]|nr:alcohol dehydrogenase [Ectothiorhodospiraceae bacterium]
MQYKKVLITGASSGIGRALAIEYARNGSDIAILARREERLRELQQEILAHGVQCCYFVCDVANLEDVRRTFTASIEELGGIDLAILNAGTGAPEGYGHYDTAKIKHVVDVNLFGIVHGIDVLIPVMREQGGGTIAGVSSVVDVAGYPGSTAYCTSKSAATTFLQGVRAELWSEGIRVLTVRPGWVKSELTARNNFTMPGIWEADRAVRRIRKGIASGKQIVQFPWHTVFASELVRFLPARLYTWLAKRVRKRM